MFGLIRYKSDDFIENSCSNSEVCVVMPLLMSLMPVFSLEYNVHELSELIILECIMQLMDEFRYTLALTMACSGLEFGQFEGKASWP